MTPSLIVAVGVGALVGCLAVAIPGMHDRHRRLAALRSAVERQSAEFDRRAEERRREAFYTRRRPLAAALADMSESEAEAMTMDEADAVISHWAHVGLDADAERRVNEMRSRLKWTATTETDAP